MLRGPAVRVIGRAAVLAATPPGVGVRRERPDDAESSGRPHARKVRPQLSRLVAALPDLCSEVLGLLGALAAIPLAGTVSVVLGELLRRRP
jgi:hypothetical protein